MNLSQWWLEGFKLRGDACKRVGIVGSVMLGVLAATVKATGVDAWVIVAAALLVIGIGCWRVGDAHGVPDL